MSMLYYSSLALTKLSFMQKNAFIDRAWYEQMLTDVMNSVLAQNLGASYSSSRAEYLKRLNNNYQLVLRLFSALEGQQGKYSQGFFIMRFSRLERMEDRLANLPFYKFKERKKLRTTIQALNQVRVKYVILFLRDSFIEANLGTEKQFFALASETAEKWFIEG